MKKLSVLLTLIWLLSAIPAAANVIVGSPADIGSGNCFPFGTSYNAEYQQVYSSSQFSGTIKITNLEFFNTQFNSGASAMPSGNWEISLSTTVYDWNSLSSTYATNIGSSNTLVFNGNLSQGWAFPETLSITLSTPFTYDPTKGNLLMDVVGTGITTSANIYFDVNSLNNYLGRVYTSGGLGYGTTGYVNNSYGLVTEFSTTAVPLPGAVWLLGSGLAGLIGWRKTFKI